MYSLRYSKPKLNGYIYRRRKKCGKPNCRCANDNKYRHTSYQLQYKELVNGKWVNKSEYVPKSQVRALRARIKRNKQREKEKEKAFKNFLNKASNIEKRLRNHFDFTALAEIKELTDEMLEIKPLNFRQFMKTMKDMFSIAEALYNLSEQFKRSLTV